MDDKLDEILDLLRSQNEMIKDIHDYVKEVTSEKYIGESRMTSFSINLAADILTEAISPKIKGMMVDLLKKQGWKTEWNMGTYERKVNQLKDLMIRKYKSAYDKSKKMDIDISSMTYLPIPDAFNVINIEKMHIILDKVNKIIDDNKDKLKNPTCSTCVHLHDNEWAKRYGKVCCSIWQVCDHYINPNSKYNRKQKTYVRRPSNKACPNYEYGDDNFENRRRCIKEKNTR